MTTGNTSRRIGVTAGGRGYDVVVGEGLEHELGRLLSAQSPAASGVCLCVDGNIPESIADGVAAACGAGTVVRVVLQADERAKTLETVGSVAQQMSDAKLDRGCIVVALGGGIVGDVAGFVAATYQRGVPVVQMPTTLLAMVDASVGGKTGVNLVRGEELRKNMVGAFHQPIGVLADVRVLGSLPERQMRCGLAECVKHAMIERTIRRGVRLGGNGWLWDWLGANAEGIRCGDRAALTALICDHVSLKSAVVEADPFETAPDEAGGRALLNLGHTFGHVLEGLPRVVHPDGHDGPLLHGEAVGLGLVCAAACGARLGLCDAMLVENVRRMLTGFGLPVRVGGLPASQELVARMGRDKKTAGGQLRLILPTGMGTARVVRGPDEAAVLAAWDEVRA